MKKINVPVFNHLNYCRYPQGISGIKEFVEFLNKNYNSFIEIEVFSREGCVSPYFIEETPLVKVHFNVSQIQSVREKEAYILPRKEYEEKLKRVISEKCVNCIHYREGDDILSHIEKISLDGECYMFEEKTE